uniref:Serine/threonine-protein phosphatase n=1 Tax=Blastobotrys adeninivorans TaxID=409370 RepID=A0A060SZJ0_BLAAD
MTSESSALELKQEGNKAFVEKRYTHALECYTKAIEKDDTQAVLYANRAQALIRLEEFGNAIADATKAIELDANYAKAYYRRAVAKMAIMKHQEALADFKLVVVKAPGDAGAKAQLAECQKMVRRLAFERAIEVEKGPSVSETIDLDSVRMDNEGGPTLDIEDRTEKGARKNSGITVKMTQEFIDQMIEGFKNKKLLPRKYVYAIVLNALALFEKDPTVVDINVGEGETLTVCGDTHGQFYDLLEIFRKNGKPSATHKYLFNGDFVDRGSWSTEVALTLYCYKLLYPQSFFINRGNHETDNMNKVYGFEGECQAKYVSEQVFKLFSESFSALPLASLIGNSYFVVHGGLFSTDGVTLDQIRKLDRFAQRQPGTEGMMTDMLWTDPQPDNGRKASKRGVGIEFGPDVTKRFCHDNNLKAVIRSHEVRMEGYSKEHDGQLITVFSAPNYCDSEGNKGAYINVDSKLELSFEQFTAVPHPDIRPMAYASRLAF